MGFFEEVMQERVDAAVAERLNTAVSEAVAEAVAEATAKATTKASAEERAKILTRMQEQGFTKEQIDAILN